MKTDKSYKYMTKQERGEAGERRRLAGLKVGHVFDVSQTEGDPLPEIASVVSADVSDFGSLTGAIRAVSAHPIEVVDGLPPETNWLLDRRMGHIAVRRGMPEGQTVDACISCTVRRPTAMPRCFCFCSVTKSRVPHGRPWLIQSCA